MALGLILRWSKPSEAISNETIKNLSNNPGTPPGEPPKISR